jgi:hypothetical protein
MSIEEGSVGALDSMVVDWSWYIHICCIPACKNQSLGFWTIWRPNELVGSVFLWCLCTSCKLSCMLLWIQIKEHIVVSVLLCYAHFLCARNNAAPLFWLKWNDLALLVSWIGRCLLRCFFTWRTAATDEPRKTSEFRLQAEPDKGKRAKQELGKETKEAILCYSWGRARAFIKRMPRGLASPAKAKAGDSATGTTSAANKPRIRGERATTSEHTTYASSPTTFFTKL